jgi:hypothetical protein
MFKLYRSSITRPEAASFGIDRRLFEIQQSLSRTHHLVLSHHNAVNNILNSVSKGSKSRSCVEERLYFPPSQANGRFRQSLPDVGISPDGEDAISTEDLPRLTSRPETGPQGESYPHDFHYIAETSSRACSLSQTYKLFRGLGILLPRDIHHSATNSTVFPLSHQVLRRKRFAHE